jgi:polysaccharide biosynthesis protein VpsM
MKHLARLAFVIPILAISAQAAPFMAVGDNAELFVTAAANLQFDSNIYLNTNNEKSDTIFSFTPGVDLVFGKGSATTGDVYYREEIRRYSSNTVQNTNLSNFGVKAKYSNGVTKADFNASYAQVAQNDNYIRATGDIVHRNVSNLSGVIEFGISEKTVIGIGGAFDKVDYGPATYTDSRVWSLPLDVYYQASPKLDWSAGYRYRSTDLSGSAPGSKDNFLSLGARGEFTPKLTGQVRAGYTQRSFDVRGSESLFGVDGNLTYLFSEKTSYRFTFSNDFGSSAFGDSTKNFTLGLNATNSFTEQWFIGAGLNYMKIEYPTRTDDFIQGQVSVTYVYNNYVNFGASLTLRNNTSGVAAAEFSQNVFSVGANIRY